ncbi:hypothetical protein K2X05_04970 [bacterium]|nr:hypothetical protein [bacterium]
MRDYKVPATVKLLDLRIAEVKGEITTHRLETRAEFAKIDARFDELRTLSLKTLATVEEQNARNRFALDGYTQVYEKLIEMDSRVERIEKHIFGA